MTNGVTVNYVYDSDDSPIYFEVTNSTGTTQYWYEKNAQGDVIGIVDANNNEVVTYTYDTWGDLLSIGGSAATTVGVQNHLLYRGYYYDSETGMYYLQSRYYDPELCRFISEDDESYHEDEEGAAANLYAYCNNDPVNNSDPDGHASFKLVGADIQIELSFGILTGGIEIIWYFSPQVNVGNRSRWKPYVYLYGGGWCTRKNQSHFG